jgi:hypothetical protein
LRWITLELRIQYDYVLLCDGLAFPLHAPTQLVHTIRHATTTTSTSTNTTQNDRQPREVWLGELTHAGRTVTGTLTDHLLRHKRLIYTTWWTSNSHTENSTTTLLKLHKRLPKHGLDQNEVPLSIRNHMIYKSTSGNQGIYSRNVISKLLNNDSVMELFARSKYGCCCCIEERNWIAALSMIGYVEQALEQTSMFQVWGGTDSFQCQGSMSNAVLSRNASICFRSEDPQRTNTMFLTNATTTNNSNPMYFLGTAMWDHIVTAQRRGVIMARKFRSQHSESQQLMKDIQQYLWN